MQANGPIHKVMSEMVQHINYNFGPVWTMQANGPVHKVMSEMVQHIN